MKQDCLSYQGCRLPTQLCNVECPSYVGKHGLKSLSDDEFEVYRAIIEEATDVHNDEVSETWVQMLELWDRNPYLDETFKAQLQSQMIKIGIDIKNGEYDI